MEARLAERTKKAALRGGQGRSTIACPAYNVAPIIRFLPQQPRQLREMAAAWVMGLCGIEPLAVARQHPTQLDHGEAGAMLPDQFGDAQDAAAGHISGKPLSGDPSILRPFVWAVCAVNSCVRNKGSLISC
jgi:hypothetical protein